MGVAVVELVHVVVSRVRVHVGVAVVGLVHLDVAAVGLRKQHISQCTKHPLPNPYIHAFTFSPTTPMHPHHKT